MLPSATDLCQACGEPPAQPVETPWWDVDGPSVATSTSATGPAAPAPPSPTEAPAWYATSAPAAPPNQIDPLGRAEVPAPVAPPQSAPTTGAEWPAARGATPEAVDTPPPPGPNDASAGALPPPPPPQPRTPPVLALLLGIAGTGLLLAGVLFPYLPDPFLDVAFTLNGLERPLRPVEVPGYAVTAQPYPTTVRWASLDMRFGPVQWMLVGVILCAAAVTAWRRSRRPADERVRLEPLCWGFGVVWLAVGLSVASYVVADYDSALGTGGLPWVWLSSDYLELARGQALAAFGAITVVFVALLVAALGRRSGHHRARSETSLESRAALGVDVAMSADEAVTYLVHGLVTRGAMVASTSQGFVTGTVTAKQKPNLLIAVLLWFVCIVPMIIYVVTAGKDVTEPFSIRIEPTATGCRLHPSGRGSALDAALGACEGLAVRPG